MYMLIKYCCVDGIAFVVCWTCITSISFQVRWKLLVTNYLKLKYFSQNSPSSLSGIVRPSYPITLVLILFRSSMDNSPFHILFSICPYNGSSLKQWSLSNMIIALMQLSHCLLDLLDNKSSLSLLPTGSSCQKSPANMIEIPPKGWFLFPMSLRFFVKRSKDTIAHEWYFINYENSYILPFVFVF